MKRSQNGAKSDAQFKKGKSGNPRGRPFGSQNMATILRRELARSITVKVSGVPRRVTVREALEEMVVNGYATASVAHMKIIESFDLVDKYEPYIIEFSETERKA